MQTENEIEKQERPHHPFSPSSLESLEVCPVFKSKQLVKLHERTIAGTRSHNSAEKQEDDSRISDDDAAAVAQCLEHVAKRKQAFIEEACTARYAAVDAGGFELCGAEHFEAKVVELNECYLAVDDQDTTAGYLDKLLLSYDRKRAVIADYKFGVWKITKAEDNLQGIAYALGVFHQYPTVEEIIVDFLQPHCAAQPITSALFKRNEITQHYFRICAVVARAKEARAKQDFSMAQPHAPVCSFCEHLGRCSKALEVALKVGNKFYPLEIPDSITPTQVLDPNQTGMAMRLAQVVATWAKAFKGVLGDRVLRGDAPTPVGYSVVTQQRRELVNLEVFRKEALKYISAKQFASTLETTFGAVETLIAETAPRGHKKSMVEQFQKAVEATGAVVKSEPYSFLKANPKDAQ